MTDGPEEQTSSRIEIADGVIEDIVEHAVGDESPLILIGRRGVDAKISNGHVRIALKVAAVIGCDINAEAAALQHRVAKAVEAAASLSVDAVDVRVSKIVFDGR